MAIELWRCARRYRVSYAHLRKRVVLGAKDVPDAGMVSGREWGERRCDVCTVCDADDYTDAYYDPNGNADTNTYVCVPKSLPR